MSKSPNNRPDGIERPWSNMSYPEPTNVQARVVHEGQEHSLCFSYSAYGGDVIATHIAASQWVQQKKIDLGVTRGNAVVAPGVYLIQWQDKNKLDTWYYKYQVGQGRDGTRRQFYIGNENTWTPQRDEAGFRAALRYRAELDASTKWVGHSRITAEDLV